MIKVFYDKVNCYVTKKLLKTLKVSYNLKNTAVLIVIYVNET